MMIGRKKVCFVVASEMTVKAFLKEQIIALSERYDVTLIVNTNQADFAGKNGLPVKVVPLAIKWSINPFANMQALHRLVCVFQEWCFNALWYRKVTSER